MIGKLLPARMLHFGVMVGGEAIQSGFHFALNILLMHLLSARDYGIFALLMVIGGLGLTYVRSLTGMPATIRIARSTTRHAVTAYDITFGTAAVVISILAGGIAGLLLHLWLEAGQVAGGAFVALWSLRSHLRSTFFARSRRVEATIGDLAFALSGAGGTALSLWFGGDTLVHIIEVLVVANLVGIVVMLALVRQPVRLSFRRAARRRYGAIWRQLVWSSLGITTSNLQAQGIAFLVTATSGPAAYAPIAAAMVFFAPLRLVSTALVNLTQPELSSLLSRGQTEAAKGLIRYWTLIVCAGTVAYGAMAAAVTPFIHTPALQDAPVFALCFFAWVIYTAALLYVVPWAALEVLGDFRAIAITTFVAAVTSLTSVILLLWLVPTAYALAGAAVSELVVLVACRRLVAVRLRGGRPDTWAGGADPQAQPATHRG
ncbi:hypothetical protein [Chthonobacter albigriseus]|uniref:hypothetical protein n=1 Tax=Chthonobacter albigriseus TaxID=1683161 RepID=UPI0015EF190E|nr:hypothetical protein [Chthonobacter albigriseus]